MSVPVLLTAVETCSAAGIAVGGGALVARDVEETQKSCASYAETAAVITPQYASSAANELDVADSAKAPCPPALEHFTLKLNGELEPHEFIGLTGDLKALGEWKLENSIALHHQDGLEWGAKVLLQSCRNIHYRYFVYVVDSAGRKQIRRWETQLESRTLRPSDHNARKSDVFGEMQINRGWLTHERIVQLKFERQKMFQVLDIEKFDPENMLVKIVPLQHEGETSLDTAAFGVNVEVTKLNYGESQLQPQQSLGVSYSQGDVVIFQITTPKDMQADFAIVFHSPEQKPLGKSVISAAELSGSEGLLALSVTGPEKGAITKIANLLLPYVIVNPFVDASLDFRTTFAHYWPKSWPNLDVGHRGNGRSYKPDPPAEVENTIASFLRAYQSHADMIELDVHLTADGVPIIYHDFGVRTAPHGKEVTRPEQLESVLIKDLSYEALKGIRVFAVINNAPVEYPAHNAESRVEHRIFPRLLDVFVGLPRSLGIDVEIKWPQMRSCGEREADQTIDKNFFIDRVLETVIKHGCGRPLIFSSFDADICTMVRFKQNLFPVMFLTMGETKRWSPYMDLRTRTFEQAINNAQAFDLAGTAPHAEDLLCQNGARMVEKARNLGQITVVWGDDCNSKEAIKYFSQIGVSATCYDRADLFVPEAKPHAFFNSSRLLQEFEVQCHS